jgi:hypothetical protein
MASTCDAAGALIIVFVYAYYSAQILLLGAELAKAYRNQSEKDRHRRHTAGKPPTAEMFTHTPAQCQQRQSRDLLDHTYGRARITRSRPLLNHLWLGYSSDML